MLGSCIAALIVCWAFVVGAAEADYFSNRSSLPELSGFLDEKTNGAFARAIKYANSESSTPCKQSELNFQLLSELGGLGSSLVEYWPSDEGGAPKPKIEDSIYAGLKITPEKPTDWVRGLLDQVIERAKDVACCASLFRIGSHVVSADKLGHFFQTGFEMLSMTEKAMGGDRELLPEHSEGRKMRGQVEMIAAITGRIAAPQGRDQVSRESYVFDLSHAQENGRVGLTLTGVKSYADIAANYEGYRFWENLYSGPRPYFACENQKWKQLRPFTWTDFASDAWDEGINCNEYSSQIRETVESRIAALPGGACPVTSSRCVALVRRYATVADRTLHPSCRGADGRAPTASPARSNH